MAWKTKINAENIVRVYGDCEVFKKEKQNKIQLNKVQSHSL